MNLHEDERAFKEMLMVASHPVEEGGIGVKLEFLEKDYWVTRSLKMLAKSRFVDQAVFKGGTSLSKACGVGYRFSEDIDIAITSEPGRSDNQTKTLVGGIGKAMSAGLEEIAMPDTRKFSKYRKVYYRYPQVEMGVDAGAVKLGVIQLEVVSFANPYPYRKRKVSCLLRDFLLMRGREDLVEQYGLTEFEVNVLDLGRTATEKMVSLMRQSLGDDYLGGLRAKIRHFYDLHYLLQDAECKAYLESDAFREDFGRLLAEDQVRFAEPAGWQGKRIEDSPLIKSFDEVWRMLRPVYEHELASLAFRPVPEAVAVEESFVKIANLLTPPFN